MKNIFFDKLNRFKAELIIGALALIAGLVMAWYAYINHLMVILADQAAHLIFSRLLTDSITPGITQIGIWPPLLHILMMPAAASRTLFETGLAGVFSLLPIFIFGSILLYRLTLRLTNNQWLAFIATMSYIFNPYILYYSVTPMMEVLFISNVIAAVYFIISWIDEDRLQYLILAGIFITLASLSRYEGLFLLPISGLVVIANLFIRRKKYNESEATIIVFGVPATIGLGALIVYNWIFAGHPFAFMGATTGMSWFMDADTAPSLTKGNFFISVQYILHASYYMFSKYLVALSFLCAFFAVLFSKNRFKTASALVLLFTPFLAVLWALYRGSNSIHVPEMPPFDRFHNDRYAATWVGFLVLSPAILLSLFKGKILQFLAIIFSVVSFAFTAYHFYNIVFVQQYSVVRNNVSATKGELSSFSRALRENYDSGMILAVRYNNDLLYIDSQIPLNKFINEGNFKYFDQTVSRPWLFARWVIMQRAENTLLKAFRDPVMEKWANSEEFNKYYTIVAEENDRRIYKLNNEAVMEYVRMKKLNPDSVPSLNSEISKWNPDTIYNQMAR